MLRSRRIALALKSSAFLVCVGFVLSNHPPAASQVPTTLVDVRQDQEIENVKVASTAQAASISKLDDTVIEQGKDIARLDTKVTIFFTLLGLMQGGGLALHLKRRQEGE